MRRTLPKLAKRRKFTRNMETTKKKRGADPNQPVKRMEQFITNRNGKKSISMYDAFLLVIFASILINPSLWTFWWLSALVFWERPHIIIRDFAENAERYRRHKAIERELIKEKNEKSSSK